MRKSRDQWRKVLGEGIAAARDDADLTQTGLASLLGWHRSKVAKIEAGIAGIETAEFVLLAKALKVEPDVLLRRVLRG